MRLAVIDSTVLLAGLIDGDNRSAGSQVVDQMIAGELLFLLSPATLLDYWSVLLRPEPMALHGMSEQEMHQLLTEITLNALWREPAAQSNVSEPGLQPFWDLVSQESEAVFLTYRRSLLEASKDDAVVMPPDAFNSRNVPTAGLSLAHRVGL